MLLLDYNEDRSTYGSLDQTEEVDLRKIKTLSIDDTERLQNKEAKVHINTLSSFKGFGGGTYKMTAVKKMTVTDDFLNMRLEDRKCKVEPIEDCRTRKLLEECDCVPSKILPNQVRALFEFCVWNKVPG